MQQNTTSFNEHGLISRMQSILGDQIGSYYQTGIGDDAAIRKDADGNKLIITTDVSVENVHFSCSYMTMYEIGYRSMVSNLSDCAAMGARPDSAVIQLVIPKTADDVISSVEELYRGFQEACGRWSFPVVGGDVSQGLQWIIGITLLGRINSEKRVLLRTGMQSGDKVWITGTPGRSAAGLSLLQRYGCSDIPEKYRSLAAAHIRPEPRIDCGEMLAEDTTVHAAMDCSDGLSKDCRTLCGDSGCGIILTAHSSQLPEGMIQLSREMKYPWQQWFFHGGEDYELLFTASADFNATRYLPLVGNGSLLCIGECSDTMSDVFVRDGTTQLPLIDGGYDHMGIILQ